MKGRAAIVTGSGRGIGRAIAERLAKEGASVLVTARTAEEVDECVRAITERGGRAVGRTIDLTRPDCGELLAGTCKEAFGRIDALVLNAAAPGPAKSIEAMTLEEWRYTQTVNLDSAFLCAQAVIPAMREQGKGRIITISSGVGVHAFPNMGAYGASKAALIHFTKTLSVELARSGITANCILPGFVLTEMVRRNLRTVAENTGMTEDAYVSLMLNGFHMSHVGRPVDVAEVAHAALHLISDEASSTTGSVFNLGGGW